MDAINVDDLRDFNAMHGDPDRGSAESIPDLEEGVDHRQPRRKHSPFKFLILLGSCMLFMFVCLVIKVKLDEDHSHIIKTDDDLKNVNITEEEEDYLEYLQDCKEKVPGRFRYRPDPIFYFSKEEERYKQEIKQAEDAFIYNPTPERVDAFLKILEKYPNSFRAHVGAAKVYNRVAYQPDNETDVIETQKKAANHLSLALAYAHNRIDHRTRQDLMLLLIDIYEDIELFSASITAAQKMVEDYPDDPSCLDRLAITYLRGRRFDEAIATCFELFEKDPYYASGYVTLGEIMYTLGKWEYAAGNLSFGVETIQERHTAVFFYEALGDSLQRLGKRQEAEAQYKKAEEKRFIPSIHQRSSYNDFNVESKPWWSVDEFEDVKYEYSKGNRTLLKPISSFYKKLKSRVNVNALREELRRALARTDFSQYALDTEQYQEGHVPNSIQEVMIYKGAIKTSACKLFPRLTRLFDTFSPTRECWSCDVKYVIMKKGHIWPRCARSNLLLTSHLALSVPSDVSISVLNETRTWTKGDVLIFDGSFEHEIWNNGTGVLMLLSFHMRHHKLFKGDRWKANLWPH